MGPGEPLFLPDDIDGALALQAEEDNTCSGCGQPRDESMRPDAEGAYRARLIACHGCAEARKAERDLNGDHSDPGIQIVIERT